MKSNKNGIVLAELLLSILILSLLLPISITTISILKDSLSFNEALQDRIALLQMKRIILLSYDMTCDNGVLNINYQNKEMTFMYKNNHVLLTPGTQIFINDIDEAYFYEDDNSYYIYYKRDNKEYIYEIS